MRKQHIVITFGTRMEGRKIFLDCLGEYATFSFIKGLSTREREAALSTADVLMSFSIHRELDPQEYGYCRNLRLIQLVTAGADHVPFALIPPGVTVVSNAGAFAEPMAEHVLAMALALAKRLLVRHRELEAGRFEQHYARMLGGSVCGILGFGGIGKATAHLMRALGVKIHAINTSGKTTEPIDFIGTLKDLKRVLHSSDVVVVSLPLNRTTTRLIGSRELGWMKRDAILINVARGEIIDEKALYEHLRDHPEFMAGIDAWWIEPFRQGEFRTNYPFFDLHNIIGTPHNSVLVPGMMIEAAKRAADNVLRFLKGESISGIVRREDYEVDSPARTERRQASMLPA